jgi:hypothetical protein
VPGIRRDIIFNILFWSIYFLYEWFGLAALTWEYDKFFINACMALPLSFLVSYLTVHVLLKRYYLNGEKPEFWVAQILMSVALLLIRRVINYYIIYPQFFPEANAVPLFSFPKLLVEAVNLYLIVGVYTMFYFVQSWYEQRRIAQDLLQQKTAAELESLKSQVQPHFIFNALNNIYSTALKRSPETATLISHLSNLLNYNLYESKQDRVPLSSEILYIKHYMELQKNRYGERLDIAMNEYDSVKDITLPPLLLLPLVENCFKHGVANSVEKSWVRIDISRLRQQVVIKIENSLEDHVPTANNNGKQGLGIENVRRRLQLLYPGGHEMKIINEPHSFLLILKLKTSNDEVYNS